jgi:hypothetical protein
MDILSVSPARLLYGHDSPDNAYLVEDYPYGRQLRCRVRYWIDTAAGGQYRGQQRMQRQTTNPRRPGHPWNRPHSSTFALRTWLYLDEHDHVQHTALSPSGLVPDRDAWLRLTGLYDQLTDDDRRLYDTVLHASRRPGGLWTPWEQGVSIIADYLALHGQPPRLNNGFVGLGDRSAYIGADAYPTAVALARTRLDPDAEQGSVPC